MGGTAMDALAGVFGDRLSARKQRRDDFSSMGMQALATQMKTPNPYATGDMTDTGTATALLQSLGAGNEITGPLQSTPGVATPTLNQLMGILGQNKGQPMSSIEYDPSPEVLELLPELTGRKLNQKQYDDAISLTSGLVSLGANKSDASKKMQEVAELKSRINSNYVDADVIEQIRKTFPNAAIVPIAPDETGEFAGLYNVKNFLDNNETLNKVLGSSYTNELSRGKVINQTIQNQSDQLAVDNKALELSLSNTKALADARIATTQAEVAIKTLNDKLRISRANAKVAELEPAKIQAEISNLVKTGKVTEAEGQYLVATMGDRVAAQHAQAAQDIEEISPVNAGMLWTMMGLPKDKMPKDFKPKNYQISRWADFLNKAATQQAKSGGAGGTGTGIKVKVGDLFAASGTDPGTISPALRNQVIFVKDAPQMAIAIKNLGATKNAGAKSRADILMTILKSNGYKTPTDMATMLVMQDNDKLAAMVKQSEIDKLPSDVRGWSQGVVDELKANAQGYTSPAVVPNDPAQKKALWVKSMTELKGVLGLKTPDEMYMTVRDNQETLLADTELPFYHNPAALAEFTAYLRALLPKKPAPKPPAKGKKK